MGKLMGNQFWAVGKCGSMAAWLVSQFDIDRHSSIPA
jgi:hypothetical protein